MPFKVRCQCGKTLTAPDSLAGKTVRCPGCKRTFALPAPGTPPPQPPAEGRQEAGALGQEIPGVQPRAPGASTFGVRLDDSTPAAPTDAKEAVRQQGGLGQEIPGVKPRAPGDSTFGVKLGASRIRVHTDKPSAGQAAAGATCPFCQAPRGPDDVICLNCGLNFQTGERISIEEDRPKRERPKKNVLLVALDVVYRPFGAVDEIGGYAENPMFIMWMWVFVAGTILLEAVTRVGVAMAQQSAQAEEAVAVAAVSLAVLFPAMLVATVVMLLIDATLYYLTGLLFGLGTGFLRLLLNLGFVGGVVRVASLLLLVFLVAGLDVGWVLYLGLLFLIWQVILYVAVLSRYYDLNFGLALGVAVIAWLIKMYFGAGLLTWVQKLMGA